MPEQDAAAQAGAPGSGAPKAGGPGGGAPFGVSPATQQTPNRGNEAAAMQILAEAVKMISEALNKAGPTSELGQNLMDPLKKLSKMVPTGTSTPASSRNVMEQAAMKNAQQNQAMQQMRQMMSQGGGGGAPKPPMPGMGAAA